MKSRRDEIDLAAQGPDPLRQRLDTYEATAALPNVKRDRGNELKRHLDIRGALPLPHRQVLFH
jgi:hypothetical protein